MDQWRQADGFGRHEEVKVFIACAQLGTVTYKRAYHDSLIRMHEQADLPVHTSHSDMLSA
eukprot:4632556-Amphidinium_carterae.1